MNIFHFNKNLIVKLILYFFLLLISLVILLLPSFTKKVLYNKAIKSIPTKTIEIDSTEYISLDSWDTSNSFFVYNSLEELITNSPYPSESSSKIMLRIRPQFETKFIFDEIPNNSFLSLLNGFGLFLIIIGWIACIVNVIFIWTDYTFTNPIFFKKVLSSFALIVYTFFFYYFFFQAEKKYNFDKLFSKIPLTENTFSISQSNDKRTFEVDNASKNNYILYVNGLEIGEIYPFAHKKYYQFAPISNLAIKNKQTNDITEAYKFTPPIKTFNTFMVRYNIMNLNFYERIPKPKYHTIYK